MEGRGFLEVAHANQHVEALVVRGISDLIDRKSETDAVGSQETAARHASAFAFEVFSQARVNHIMVGCYGPAIWMRKVLINRRRILSK